MYKKHQAVIVAVLTVLIIIIIILSIVLLPAKQPAPAKTTTYNTTTTQVSTKNDSALVSNAISNVDIASNNYSINSSYSITVVHDLPSYAPYPYIYKNTTSYRIDYSRSGNYSVIKLFRSALLSQNTTLFAINSLRYVCVTEFNATSPVCYSQLGADGANITTIWNNSLDILTLDGLNITVPYYAPNSTSPTGFLTISTTLGLSGAGSTQNMHAFNFSNSNIENSSYLGNECKLINSKFNLGKNASGRIAACISEQYKIPLTYELNLTLNASYPFPTDTSLPGFVLANSIDISYKVTNISEIRNTNQSAILPPYMRSYLSSNSFIIAHPRGS